MKRALLLTLLLLIPACRPDSADDSNTPEALYERAKELLKPNVERQESDFAGAMECLQQAARGGLLRAQLDLGGIYFAGGQGLAADAQQAFHWFTKAAAQGNKEAEVFLGILYYDGSLGAPDVQKAMNHWRNAAMAGIAEAQYRLGRVLAQTESTRAEGMEWLAKASASVPQASTALGNLYYKYLNESEKAAVWYEKGAMAGDPLAQHIFAEMLLLGEPVQKDADRGLAMLRMAAGQDYKPAMARLINILRNSAESAEHESEATAWDKRLQDLLKQEKQPGAGKQ